jgi:hypothetical protein
MVMEAWRLADQPDNFLHLVLKSKYFPDSSIWRPNSNIPKSAFWASILRILPILKAHSFYQITMGQISVWSTPWCHNWTQIYDSLIIQPSNYTYPSQIRDLWIPGHKCWDVQLIDNLFQEHMAEAIKNTLIIRSQGKYCLSVGNSHLQKNAIPKVLTKLALKICISKVNRGQYRLVSLQNNFCKLFRKAIISFPW